MIKQAKWIRHYSYLDWNELNFWIETLQKYFYQNDKKNTDCESEVCSNASFSYFLISKQRQVKHLSDFITINCPNKGGLAFKVYLELKKSSSCQPCGICFFFLACIFSQSKIHPSTLCLPQVGKSPGMTLLLWNVSQEASLRQLVD